MHRRRHGSGGVVRAHSLRWSAAGLAVAAACLAACGAASPKPSDVAPAPVAHLRDDTIVELFDAFGRSIPGTTKGWGFSAIVRHGGRTILFDSGGSADVLAENARALGVDLRDVDVAVLSHDHSDHASGFAYVASINSRAVFYLPNDSNLGSDWDQEVPGVDPSLPPLPDSQRYFDGTTKKRTHMSSRYWPNKTEFVVESREIAPGVSLIATSSPYMGSFYAYPPFEKNPQHESLPELSLVLDTSKGDVLIVGCSHSSIETIVKATRELRKKPIELIEGGLHLLPYDAETIRSLATRLHDEYGVHRIAPAHCTGHRGFQILEQVFGERYVVAGLGSEVAIAP